MRTQYLNKLTELLKKNGVDAILIAPSEEMEFIAGHSPFICERFQALFIQSNGNYFYICNLLTLDEMQGILGPDKKVYGWFDGNVFTDTVKKAFEENGLIGKTIAVNSSERGVNILEIMKNVDVKFVNGKPLLEEMRIIKNEEEITNLRKAAHITDETFTELCKYIKPGIKEIDISNKIQELFREKGVSTGFAMVCSGPNSALPHYAENQRVITEKDVIILDFGCVYNNMCADMSRMVFVGGISEEEKTIYNIVLESHLAGEAKAVNGAFIPDVDAAARDIITKAGHEKHFFTRLGHGIGYSVHEAPDIKASNKRNLEPGMAFSIEPGIYMVGKFGMRIEDIVVITKDGHEVLNQSTKEIVIVCPK